MERLNNNTAIREKLIINFLQKTYGFEVPSPRDYNYDRAPGRKYLDYVNARKVARIMTENLREGAKLQGQTSSIVPEGWTAEDAKNHAKIAFNIASVCRLKRMVSIEDVLDSYFLAVSLSDPPKFCDGMPEFIRDVFTSQNGEAITGGKLLSLATETLERQERNRKKSSGMPER